MKFCVPFIPDDAYAEFLLKEKKHLASLYFGLHSGPVLDARVRFSSLSARKLADRLAPFTGIDTYCLLNSRFVPPTRYFDKPFLLGVLDTLASLFKTAGLTGIVFSDLYFLEALSQTRHEILPNLSAVPGVNSMIDSAAKAFSILDAVARTRFKLPEKLILDRSLNRDKKTIARIKADIQNRFPQIQIELLANEGCLLHCPFKPAHDAQIALANSGLSKEDTFRINRALGCHGVLWDRPHLFFASPFIRPEDAPGYEGLVHTLKICGRTLGPGFLSRTVKAYAHRSFDGNLLELMDAAHFLSERFHVDNKAVGRNLSPKVFNSLSKCDKSCGKCGLCPALFQKTARKKALTLAAYKDLK